MLNIQNVSKNFGGIQAINNISFNIYQNQIFGLIGPNGAGKTTLFNIITGNYTASSGDVYLQDTKITNQKNYKIVHLGIARTFQNIRLFSSMSVLDNILIALDNSARYNYFEAIFRLPRFFVNEQKILQKACEIMEFLQIKSFAHTLATNLSYGNQRKVEIARAMATSPKILLLDEPAAGMNPQETLELANLLQSIKNTFNVSILLIEHDMKFVNRVCEEVLVLDYGKSIFKGKMQDALNDTKVIKAYLGDFDNA